MKGKNAAGERKTRSLRIMNMHIPYHIVMIIWSFISFFPLFFLVILFHINTCRNSTT